RASLPKVTSRSEPALLPRKWPKDMDPMITQNKNAQGKAVIFHDSFGRSWTEFLAYHFETTVYLWQYNLAPAFIEREKPTLVINEIVERVFNTEDPEKLLISD